MKIKVGVMFGGVSVEHEVSIISAVQAMHALNKDKYEVIPIYMAKDRTWYTGAMLTDIEVYKDFEDLKRYAKKVVLINKDGKICLESQGLFKRIVTDIDIILPVVHGNGVEDGTLAGYLETIGAPFVGPKVLGSALGQDKVVMKQIFESEDIPHVKYDWFYDYEYNANNKEIESRISKLGYPVIVKPATLGSSVGITVVKDESKLAPAILEAIAYDSKVVVEKMVDNLDEVNCSVLGNYEYQETSEIEEVISSDHFLTYNDKYVGGSKGSKKGMVATDRIIPARIDAKTRELVTELAKKTYKALNLSGICRVDFLIDKKSKKVYVNEPNTIPGSLSFYLWEPINKEYDELLDDAITYAIKEYKIIEGKTSSFSSNILSNYGGCKGLKGSKGKLKM